MPHHKSMVPEGFNVPERLVTETFTLRPLLAKDAEVDFEAWTTSVEHLQGIFGPRSSWPSTDIGLEDNTIDLAWHQREHEMRSSFAFAVVSPDDTTSLGCVYFTSARKLGYEVETYYWVRASQLRSGLDIALGDAVRSWLKDDWPFQRIAYPGRDVQWPQYEALEDQPHW